MINQVSPHSAFKDFTQPDYRVRSVVKKRQTGLIISASALAVGFGTLLLVKGAVPRFIMKNMYKWELKLNEKIAHNSRFKNIYRFMLSRADGVITKLESINNFTSLKDILFQKFMWGEKGNRTFTRKIHEGISGFFNKISRKTVNSSYASTQAKFASLNEYIVETNNKILAENPNAAKIVDNITQKMKRVNQYFDNGFSVNARNERLNEMKKATDGLFDYFWNMSLSDVKNFKSKKMWQTFIADEYIRPSKSKLLSQTSLIRNLISHDVKDNYKTATDEMIKLGKYIKISDISANELMNSLKNNLTKHKKADMTNEILADLNKLLSILDNENAKVHVNEISRIIKNSSKGLFQDILEDYKNILPEKDCQKLKSRMLSIIQSLDGSIETENIQYFEKLRDLKLGSAPTDILSIIMALATVGWFTCKSKDKDERVSASLKYGIPAVGAVATSLYCTARLISGGKAFILSLIAGWLINKAGTKADNFSKKYSLNISLDNRKKSQSDRV